jgi:hypothetical protein
VGVVVSPPALLAAQAYVDRNVAPMQQRLLAAIDDAEDAGPAITDLPAFVRGVLGWQAGDLVDPAPPDLDVALPEFDEVLRPTYAVREPEPDEGANPWMLLVQEVDLGTGLDEVRTQNKHGWPASAQAKFERLLRENQVPIGLLSNGTQVRLVHAPRGETSGYITFPVAAMTEVAGRPLLAAFVMLLGFERLFILPKDQRLPAVLNKSRLYQNEVSTRLSGQVLAALYELLRGFQAADEQTGGELLRAQIEDSPDTIYEGLLTVLLRLVFLLYAEDRALLPRDEAYLQNYSVSGLFDRLRSDADRYADTMNQRYGAWAQLLTLFRMLYGGAHCGGLQIPARHGHLFDPDRFPFLEGRRIGSSHTLFDHLDVPLVSDGVIWGALKNLLILDGERLSYRGLDVEQIGSVYETMMGFRLERAPGHAIAVKPAKPHGPPITVDLDTLLGAPSSKRAELFRKQADRALTPKEAAALAAAINIQDAVGAIEGKVDRRATPEVVVPGAMTLQPNEERRRSGSHYTPRSLTEPIVRTTLKPVLDRLGSNPRPEAILQLKVCDETVGSGAFLVEACRQLSEVLVDSWHTHNCLPHLPPDSDELLYARRLIAQRCLYGVDRNPIAVDLAKLSLWLATLARDHAFTFLDHALRVGDSLVGLSRDQISAFHWDPQRQRDFVTRSVLEGAVGRAESLRAQIRGAEDDVDSDVLDSLLRESDAALDDLRMVGDLAILAFFDGRNAKERQSRRDELAQKVWAWQRGGDRVELRSLASAMRAARGIAPFHWELEFPEVFDRQNPGFDAIVGNPPFLGGTRISTVWGMSYFQWLTNAFPPCEHLCDVVAYFFRNAFNLLRASGAFGLIATNTISQGDTREGGLRTILSEGGQIYSATRRFKWPGSVAVVVSVVHVLRQHVAAWALLDGVHVSRISAYLAEGSNDESPARLSQNPYFSLGIKIYGQGFLFADDDPECTPTSERDELIARRPALESRIRPYIGGEEILSHPRQMYHRYVIQLSDLQTESDLEQWPELRDIVREKVRPGRDALGENPNNIPLKKKWWAFQAHRPELGRRLASMHRVLVTSQVNPQFGFALMPSDWTFSHAAIVFCIDSHAGFAAIQSRVHEIWARAFSSTAMELMRYTPSDCFETFPFPPGWAGCALLDSAGEAYYEFRAAMMVRNDEGMTKTYNRFHDPEERSRDVMQLRALHDDMDRAVLDSYGWHDLRPPREFILTYDDDDDGSRRKKP